MQPWQTAIGGQTMLHLLYRAFMPEPKVAPCYRARRAALAGLAVAVTASVLLTLAVATGGQQVSWLDHPITEITRNWADTLRWPVKVAHVAGMLSQPAGVGLLVALLALWLIRTGLLAIAGLLAISAITGSIATRATKTLVRRERPPSAEGLVNDMTVSFPSGHSSAGVYLFIAAGLVLLQLGRVNRRVALVRAGVALLLLGPLIGISRLILGAHWPSDILAGWAFGATALLSTALLLWTPLAHCWHFPDRLGSCAPREER